MRNKYLSVIIILCFFTHYANGQSVDSLAKKNAIVFEIDVENGGILAEKELKKQTFKGAFYSGLNLKVGWRIRNSKDPYFKLYNNPTYGVGLYSSTFRNDIIGKPYALYGFVQTPFGNMDNKIWSFDYRIGLGLSGNFNPYNTTSNPLNLAIGSKNNVFVDLGINSRYQISDKLKVGIGLSYRHFSNGAIRLPNKGINLAPVTVSLTYQPDGFSINRDTSTPMPFVKKTLYHINTGVGFKQLSYDSKTRYFKSTFSLYASRKVSLKWRLGGGFDIFYSDSGNSQNIARENKGKLNAKISGGPAFYIVHILNEDLVLNGNIGYYIHKQQFNGEIKKIFLRAGFRYYIYKNINTGISIKAHTGKADFIEWTLGYTINR